MKSKNSMVYGKPSNMYVSRKAVINHVRCCWLLNTIKVTNDHQIHNLAVTAKLNRRRQWHPLQSSWLENPVDGGAWWAAVHGVAKSRTRLSDFTFTHWRRQWQPTPGFLPGEPQGRGSLLGCRLWVRTESDRTEAT